MTSTIYVWLLREIGYMWISHLIYLSVHELPQYIPRRDSTCESEFDILDVCEQILGDIPLVMTSVKRYDAGEPFDIRQRHLANGM